MGLAHNPIIVLKGLTHCYDAANPRSYSGSGVAWNNLVKSVNTGTLINSPAYSTNNLGYFTFDTTNYIDLGNVYSARWYNFTWAAWIKTTTQVNRIFNFNANIIIGTPQTLGGGSAVLTIINEGKFIYYDESGLIGGVSVGSNKIINDGVWHYVAAGKQNNNVKLWVDGIKYADSNIGDDGSPRDKVLIANSGASEYNKLDGTISIVHIYDRQLSTDEISQNYHAYRGRYSV